MTYPTSSIPSSDYHIPVLFHETIQYLNINPDGIYVDATFGGGGHSRGILSQLSDKGKLIAFEQDADAKEREYGACFLHSCLFFQLACTHICLYTKALIA